jgi:hypothetical protein
MISEMLTNYLATVLIALLLILLSYLIAKLRQALPVWMERAQSELGKEQWELLLSMARTIILSAEQVAGRFGLDTGEKKKAFVVEQLENLATTYKIPVTREQIETLVEGVLKEIKRESTEIVLGELQSLNG